MKILVITQYFHPEPFRINDLVLGLRQRGHRVEILTGMPNYPSGRFYAGYSAFGPWTDDFHGMPVHRVPLMRRGERKNWRLAANYISFALSACALGPLRCRGAYDVIFVYEPSPVTVALPGIVLRKLKQAPMLFWVQDLWPESLSATGAVRSRWLLRLVRRLVDFIYRRCDRVLVSSTGFTGHVAASGIAAERIVNVPNWAENAYRPLDNPPPEILTELPAGFRVMFAGNIGSAQAFDTILAAAEKLRDRTDIQWVILGDGMLKSWVAEEVRRRGLERQFHLLGHRPLESMAAYFSAADALLVTLRDTPAFALTVPSKVQSYLACGRPIIAAINGEGADLVSAAGAGLTCPAENADRLAQTVVELCNMPQQQRTAMGHNGRAYFEANFERELVIDRIERLMLAATEKTCAS
ncbi:MAG: glycosyltransferase family 4 protein [Burkholderiales bacterium]